MHKRIILTVSIFVFMLTKAILAEETEDMLIHSDVPLFGYDEEVVWPKSFEEETTIGCASIIPLGDWKYINHNTADPEEDILIWYRLSLASVLHCHLTLSESYERNALPYKTPRVLYLLSLGQTDTNKLWALQIGSRPGSDYILLSSNISNATIYSYHVLQVACPRENIRKGPTLNSLRTDYCSINSQESLRHFAIEMSKRPPSGELKFVESVTKRERDLLSQ